MSTVKAKSSKAKETPVKAAVKAAPVKAAAKAAAKTVSKKATTSESPKKTVKKVSSVKKEDKSDNTVDKKVDNTVDNTDNTDNTENKTENNTENKTENIVEKKFKPLELQKFDKIMEDNELEEIKKKIKILWDKPDWNKKMTDIVEMIKLCKEYLCGGGVLTSEEYNLIDGNIGDSTYRSPGLTKKEIFEGFSSFYNTCGYPDERVITALNSSKSDDLLKMFLEKHDNIITLEYLIELCEKHQKKIIDDSSITVDYDSKTFMSVFENKKEKALINISDDVYKMLVSHKRVAINSKFVSIVAEYGKKSTLEYLVMAGGIIDGDILDSACRSTIDRHAKMNFLLTNKILPEERHFNTIIKMENQYNYRRGGIVRRNENENSTKNCIEELIKYGYHFTYPNMLECILKSVVISKIDRFGFVFDERYLIACAKTGVYPYEVDIKPNMKVLEAECDKPGNLTIIKRIYNQIKGIPSSICIENACKYKNNFATVNFLVSKDCPVTIQCVQNVANSLGSKLLNSVLDVYMKNNTKDSDKLTIENSFNTYKKTSKSSKSKDNKKETDENADKNADEKSNENKDESNNNEDDELLQLEQKLTEIEKQLIDEGITDNIVEFRNIPQKYNLYCRLYSYIPESLTKLLNLDARNKKINFLDLVTHIIKYCSAKKLIEGDSINVEGPLKYKDISKVMIDDIQKWVYSLVYDEKDVIEHMNGMEHLQVFEDSSEVGQTSEISQDDDEIDEDEEDNEENEEEDEEDESDEDSEEEKPKAKGAKAKGAKAKGAKAKGAKPKGSASASASVDSKSTKSTKSARSVSSVSSVSKTKLSVVKAVKADVKDLSSKVKSAKPKTSKVKAVKKIVAKSDDEDEIDLIKF